MVDKLTQKMTSFESTDYDYEEFDCVEEAEVPDQTPVIKTDQMIEGCNYITKNGDRCGGKIVDGDRCNSHIGVLTVFRKCKCGQMTTSTTGLCKDCKRPNQCTQIMKNGSQCLVKVGDGQLKCSKHKLIKSEMFVCLVCKLPTRSKKLICTKCLREGFTPNNYIDRCEGVGVMGRRCTHLKDLCEKHKKET